MVNPQEAGLFFSIPDLRALFPRLKSLEYTLQPREQAVLTKIEQTLYEHLTVREIEALLREDPEEPKP
jgi:hypothetical protein